MQTMNLFGKQNKNVNNHYTKAQLDLLEKIMPPDAFVLPDEERESMTKEDIEQREEELDRYEQLNVLDEANILAVMYDSLAMSLKAIMNFYAYYNELPDEIKNKYNIIEQLKELMPPEDYGMSRSEIQKTLGANR